MSEHTKEPWYVFSHYGDPEIRTKEGDKLVAALLPSKLADARRIVACVNACRGASTEVLESGVVHDWSLLMTELEKQRDQLLATLQQIADWPREHEVCETARKAIAATKGGAV